MSWYEDRSVWSDRPLYDAFRQAEREDDVYGRYGGGVSWGLGPARRSGSDATPLAVKLRTVKGRVRYLLEHYPESRNSDLLLIILYLREFTDLGKFIKYIPYQLIKKHEGVTESVRRARQLIQASGELLPTDPKVLEARKRKERRLRKLLGGRDI